MINPERLGATHWDVEPHVERATEEVQKRFGCTWNTYKGHGLWPALGERLTVDHWGPQGRGSPLPERTGDAMVGWLLGQHVIQPLRVLIWWSYIWTPQEGWKPYSGFQGNHGPGGDAHIHVGYARAAKIGRG